MKKIADFMLLGSMILAGTFVSGCENGQKSHEIEPEYVTMSVKPAPLEITESPMSKAETNNSGLYGVYIQDYATSQYYMFWLTDDLSASTIKLVKDREYRIGVTYFPKGKEEIYHEGNVYGSPFYGTVFQPELGGQYYGSDPGLMMIGFSAQRYDKKSYKIQTNAWCQIERYAGGVQVKASEDGDINVALVSMMWGLEVSASNLEKGKIHIYSSRNTNNSYAAVKANDGYSYDLTPETPFGYWELEMFETPYVWFDVDWYYENMRIDYEDESGRITNLYEKEFVVKRHTKYSIHIDVQDVLDNINGVVKAHVTEDAWKSTNLGSATGEI